MPFTHTNRRGVNYFIQAKDRNGKSSYSATTKPVPDALDQLPAGYEMYEKPDTAQAFVRKIKPAAILPAEHRKVEDAIRLVAKLEYFIVETDGDRLVVYTPEVDFAERMEWLDGRFPLATATGADRAGFIARYLHFTKMMRFTLTDECARLFTAERWCFRGSVDDWITLDYGSPLPKLLKKYTPHLGRESFYDLM